MKEEEKRKDIQDMHFYKYVILYKSNKKYYYAEFNNYNLAIANLRVLLNSNKYILSFYREVL